MPTIEIVSIDCLNCPELPNYSSFAYRMENKLVSHRGLFQYIFNKLHGVIVHLADKDMEGGDVPWWAGDIVDWSETEEEQKQGILKDENVLAELLDAIELAKTDEEKSELESKYTVASIICPPRDRILFFLPQTRIDVMDLMSHLLKASSQHLITFSTDYQFGGKPRNCGTVTLTEFWKLHDQKMINFNSLYFIS